MLMVIIAAAVLGAAVLFCLVTMIGSWIAYKRFFRRRFNGNPNLRYFTAEDFPALKADPVTFAPDRGQILRGFIYSSEKTEPRGLIVFSHGFGAGHQSYTTEINTLAQAGFAVLAYDGTGCVASDGDCFRGFDQGPIDLKYALRFAAEDERLRRFDCVVLFGHSWGSFSVMNCAEEKRVTGVVAMCGFISSAAVVAQSAVGQNKKKRARAFWHILFPWLYLLNKTSFGENANKNSLDSLLATKKEVLLMYGEKDNTVYFPNNGAILQEKLKDKKNIRFQSYQDKGHNVYLTCEAEREMNRVFGEIAKVSSREKARLKQMYANVNYEEITQEDKNVMGEAIRFCRRLTGVFPRRTDC